MEKGEDRKIQPELLKTEAEVCQTKTKELRHSHTPKAGRISLTFPSFIVLGENVSHSTGEQLQPHQAHMISATGTLCSRTQPSPGPS